MHLYIIDKRTSTLENDFKELIKDKEEIFNEICKFKKEMKDYLSDNKWRQDYIKEYPIKATVDLNELKDIYFYSSFDSNYNAEREYNMKSYLTKLLTCAHVLNEPFQKKMKFIMSKYGNVHSGPVKGYDRCVSKTESDYFNNQFPTTAHIIDIIRCSITFNDLQSYYNGLIQINKICQDGQKLNLKESLLNDDDIIIRLMRCKNGYVCICICICTGVFF